MPGGRASRAQRRGPTCSPGTSSSSLQLENEDGVGYSLEGLAGCAVVEGDIRRAGLLFGAADAVRTRTGLIDQRAYVTYQPFVERMLASEGAAQFTAAREEGGRMSRRAALDLAFRSA